MFRNIINSAAKNRVWIIIAFIHWFLLMILQVDRKFFEYEKENDILIISKLLALLLLEAIWIISAKVYQGWEQKEAFYRRFVHIWSIYALFVCCMLLLLWPGTWSWDDLWVLSNAQYYRMFAWQHVLSSVEQIVFLQLFPTPGGYVLVKNLLIAAIIAYSICTLEDVFQIQKAFIHHYWLDILVKLLPAMLPPVLMYQFSGYRIGLYIYLEFLMFVVMIASLKGFYRWTEFRTISIAILVAICACWRTEAFFYALLGVLFFAFAKNPTFTKKLRIMGTLTVIFVFTGLVMWQNHSLKNKNYELMSTMRPMVELIRHADPEKNRNELSAIDKVLDVKIVKEHPYHNGMEVYWGDNAVKKYTRDEYKEYLHSFFTLSLQYPLIVARERLNVFRKTSGFFLGGQFNSVSWAVEVFNPTSSIYKAYSSIITSNKYPIFPKLRSKIINAMGMKWKGTLVQPFYSLVWNIIVPMAVLIAAGVGLVKKRKTEFVILLSFLLIKMPIIFLTAPATCFMYYASFYFFGYIFLDYYVLYRLCRKREEVKKNE